MLPSDWKELRALGKGLGAEWVVYGSLTKIGQRLSLNGNLLEMFGQTSFILYDDRGGTGKPGETDGQIPRSGVEGLGPGEDRRDCHQGNQRIESQAIEREIKSKAGEAYHADLLDQDLRTIFKMGFFSDVRLEVWPTPQGK